MFLAIKNGRIGRVKNTINGVPDVATAVSADQRGELYVSTSTLARDQALLDAEKTQKLAVAQARKIQKENFQRKYYQDFLTAQKQAQLEAKNKPLNSDEVKMKRYFSEQMGRSETENVARTLKADFYDRTQILETQPSRPIVARADFMASKLTGNPLTRDGAYGPVSDYEKIVQGVELNNDRVTSVVGGTILRKHKHKSEMGFDWGAIWDNAVDQAETSIDDKITSTVANAINPQQSQPATQVINIARPQSSTSKTLIPNVPDYVTYGAGALAGLGLLMFVMKKSRA